MSRNPDLSIVPTAKERDAKNAEEIDEEEDEEEEEGEGDEGGDEEEEEEECDEDDDEEVQVTTLDSDDVDDDDIGQTAESGTVRTSRSVKTVKTSKAVTSLPAYIPETETVDKKKKDNKKGRKATPAGDDMQIVQTEGDNTKDQDDSMQNGSSSVVRASEEDTDGCRWVMQRLRGLGSDPRGSKRFHVIKVR